MRLPFLLVSLCLSLCSFGTYAKDADQEQIQVTRCLATHLPEAYKVLAENRLFKIVEVPSTALPSIQHLADLHECGRFINVSMHLEQSIAALKKMRAIPRIKEEKKPALQIKHLEEVRALLTLVEPTNILHTVAHLSSYTNRSATQPTGVETANWITSQFKNYAKMYGRTDIKTFTIPTGGRYIQPSVVTILGSNLKKAPIVIGAHMDTLGESPNDIMPGADDDGSGSASILEMARVMMASNVKLKRPIYFIWYAAEERGLIGSQKVVDYFVAHHLPVYAVMQFDMTGYRHQNDESIWLFEDYTNKHFTDFMAQLVNTYLQIPVNYSRCGYGCSDHVPWYMENYPTVFPTETSYKNANPHIHTALDTIDNLSVEHMTHFTQLGMSFILETAL